MCRRLPLKFIFVFLGPHPRASGGRAAVITPIAADFSPPQIKFSGAKINLLKSYI
jgi:hypothetical protein